MIIKFLQESRLLFGQELLLSLNNRFARFKALRYRDRKNLKLNLGCGKNIKSGWVNIDAQGSAELHLDLRKGFPFQDNSCSFIYSEHFFEHLEHPYESEGFLSESFRVLKTGGVFSVGVPDTELVLNAYVEGQKAPYFKWVKAIHPKECITRLDHINYHFRQFGQHKYAYDFETLSYLLEKHHFRHVKKRKFDPLFDNESRKLGTLYISAVK